MMVKVMIMMMKMMTMMVKVKTMMMKVMTMMVKMVTMTTSPRGIFFFTFRASPASWEPNWAQ